MTITLFGHSTSTLTAEKARGDELREQLYTAHRKRLDIERALNEHAPAKLLERWGHSDGYPTTAERVEETAKLLAGALDKLRAIDKALRTAEPPEIQAMYDLRKMLFGSPVPVEQRVEILAGVHNDLAAKVDEQAEQLDAIRAVVSPEPEPEQPGDDDPDHGTTAELEPGDPEPDAPNYAEPSYPNDDYAAELPDTAQELSSGAVTDEPVTAPLEARDPSHGGLFTIPAGETVTLSSSPMADRFAATV